MSVHSVSGVILGGPGVEVRWFATEFHVAFMADEFPVRYWSASQFVAYSMCWAMAGEAVAVRVSGAGPDQAACIWVADQLGLKHSGLFS